MFSFSCTKRKKEVPFSMATGNELLQECFLIYTLARDQQEWNETKKKKGEIYGQEPPSLESTTTECVVNYYYYFKWPNLFRQQ